MSQPRVVPGEPRSRSLVRAADRRRRGPRRHLAPEPRPRRTPSARRRAPAHDARRQPERRARERAAVRRDEAAADRDKRARGGAGDHQQRPGGPRRASSTCSRCTTWSATRSSEIFDAQVVDIGITTGRNEHDRLPVRDRARRAFPTSRSGRGSRASASTVIETGEPLVIDDMRRVCAAQTAAGIAIRQSAPASPSLFAPLIGRRQGLGRHLAPEPRPRARVQRSATCAC